MITLKINGNKDLLGSESTAAFDSVKHFENYIFFKAV